MRVEVIRERTGCKWRRHRRHGQQQEAYGKEPRDQGAMDASHRGAFRPTTKIRARTAREGSWLFSNKNDNFECPVSRGRDVFRTIFDPAKPQGAKNVSLGRPPSSAASSGAGASEGVVDSRRRTKMSEGACNRHLCREGRRRRSRRRPSDLIVLTRI